MTKDEQIIVKRVLARFKESDKLETEWSEVDEQMSRLEWLDNHQLTIEAGVKLDEHAGGNPKCGQNHAEGECFVPVIIDAVCIILNLYDQTGNLHANNRFILEYYLSLSQTGFIVY